MALVETNLTPDIHDSELGFLDYTIFRCDRTQFLSSKQSGGGVLVAVHNSFTSCMLSSNYNLTEHVFVQCSSHPFNIIVGCVYIPPSQPLFTYANFCNTVDDIMADAPDDTELLLLGDFNLPNTDWNDKRLGASVSSDYILELAASHDLKQCNVIPNYRGIILDLVFSSIPDTVVAQAVDVLVQEDRHHPALSIVFTEHFSSPSHSVKFVQDFRNCNMDQVFRQLQMLPFPIVNGIQDPVDHFNSFINTLAGIIAQNSPMKKIVKSNFPKWFSRDLQRMVILKKTSHKRFKTTGNPIDLETFRNLRTQCKALTTKCYNDYIGKVEASIPSDIKSFWSHVNGLRNDSTIPPKLILNDSVALDPSTKCSLFRQHFSSVFCKSDIPVPSFDFGFGGSIAHVTVTAAEVQDKLIALDPCKSAGPDNIPPRILKYCAPVIAVHLAVLFNLLLSIGVFPSCLKKGFVVPIFKSGSRNDVKNYRPIVIQSAIAKIFESLVLDHLYFFLKPHISIHQHGFLHGRSTITNLLEFQEFVMSAFVDSCQVDCLYLDFSKAFDMVHHNLLVAKLKGYGVTGLLLKWIDCYLKDRTLVVKCDGDISESFPVLSGVPQGSHLGPLLFIAFLNDVTSLLTSRFLLFADDLKIFTRISSPLDQIQLQHSLVMICEWCKSNAMLLNTSKCQVVTFSRSSMPLTFNYAIEGTVLVRVDQVKDLGVIFTSTLNPFEHISYITSRAHSLLGFIFRSTKHFRSPECLVTLYKSLVRPILDYGSVIWTPYQVGHIDMLRRVQVRFVRGLGVRLGFTYLDAPVGELEQLFDLQSLKSRRNIADMVLLFKLVNGLLDSPELLSCIGISAPRGTRSKTIFCRRYLPTSYALNSGLSRLLRTGSVAASRVDFFHGSLVYFKRRVACALDPV